MTQDNERREACWAIATVTDVRSSKAEQSSKIRFLEFGLPKSFDDLLGLEIKFPFDWFRMVVPNSTDSGKKNLITFGRTEDRIPLIAGLTYGMHIGRYTKHSEGERPYVFGICGLHYLEQSLGRNMPEWKEKRYRATVSKWQAVIKGTPRDILDKAIRYHKVDPTSVLTDPSTTYEEWVGPGDFHYKNASVPVFPAVTPAYVQFILGFGEKHKKSA